MNKISAVIVIHNEEKVIDRCLNSIKGLVNEIIIIHDGPCEDKSIDICRRYTDNITIRYFVGIAEEHKAYGFKRARYDWILSIDADEFLRKVDFPKIREMINSKNIDGYSFLWRLWNGKKYITKSGPFKTVLIRKSELKFIGFPQSELLTKSGKIKETLIHLEHQPNYNNFTIKSFRNKWMKWIKIQAHYVNRDYKSIDKIGYDNQTDWSKAFKLKRKYALFWAPIEGSYGFVSRLYNSKGENKLFSLKQSVMWGMYCFFEYIYVWKYRKERNK